MYIDKTFYTFAEHIAYDKTTYGYTHKSVHVNKQIELLKQNIKGTALRCPRRAIYYKQRAKEYRKQRGKNLGRALLISGPLFDALYRPAVRISSIMHRKV
jgi:hypothetical protein